MKWNALELAGKRFGRLVVISRSENMGSQRAWNCACDCGGSSVVRGSSLKRIDGTRSCGCLIIESQKKAGKSRSGSNHYNWSGGKTEAKDGYIYLSGHVSLTTKTRCALEHRIVMENLLGRKLIKGESVHHKNGIRNDNRPENLELWSKSQPAGQRIEDKLQWAIEFIKTHKPELLCQT